MSSFACTSYFLQDPFDLSFEDPFLLRLSKPFCVEGHLSQLIDLYLVFTVFLQRSLEVVLVHAEKLAFLFELDFDGFELAQVSSFLEF